MIKKETTYGSLFLDDSFSITVCEEEGKWQDKVKVEYGVGIWEPVDTMIENYKQIVAELEQIKKVIDSE